MNKLEKHLFILAGLCFILFAAVNAHALTPNEAGQKGIDWMTPATVNWQNSQNCFGCHIQGETIWGLSIGKNRGYSVDNNKLSVFVNALKSWQCASNGSWSWNTGCSTSWRNESTVFAASGLAFYDRIVATDAQGNLLKAAAYLKNIQYPSGYWAVSTNGTRIMNGQYFWGTAMGIIAVKRAADLTGDPTYKASYEKAVAWLKTRYSTYVQDNAFKLIGLIEGGVPNTDTVVADTMNRLLNAQRSDGGWGVNSGYYTSNSYNTGQAVYSLRLAGMNLWDSVIDRGIQWLLANQYADGSWPQGSAGVANRIASTMWPVIALGQFGSLGVEISADPMQQEIAPYDPDPQTVTYAVTVKNTGSRIQDDTYDLSASGLMEGWGASLSQTEITLPPEASGIVTLSVTAPSDLPEGLPSMITVTAVSRTNPDVSSSVTVTTYTPPAPPVTGHETAVIIIEGDNSSISQCDTITISAEVVDQVTGGTLTGPAIGAVNFLVAGVAVGSASDDEGTGVFTITWNPGSEWLKFNSQTLLAVYSGFDYPDTDQDLLSSHAAGSVTISAGICNTPPVVDAGPDQTIECSGPSGTPVTLDGSGSSDPEGDELTYAWTWDGGSAEGINPTVTLPYGITTVTLTVSDGEYEDTDQVDITIGDTTPPTTSAILEGELGNNGWYISDVTVTFTSTDTCTGVKEIHDTINGDEIVTSGYTASFTLNQDGTYAVTYWSVDNAGNVEQAKGFEVRMDKTAPIADISVTPGLLWPPNHKMVDVAVNGGANDPASEVASIEFTVTDEYGTVEPVISGFNTTISLEAWRNGGDRDGRHYTITAVITDKAGNVTTVTTEAVCPHDMREKK